MLKKNLVHFLSNGKELVIGQCKHLKKQPKLDSLLFIVNQEPDSQDLKLQLFLKLCQQAVSPPLPIWQFITCVHGSSTNLAHKPKNKDIFQDLFPWMIFHHIAWQNPTADLILRLWRHPLKNKEMSMFWMDQKCSSQAVVFQVSTSLWLKHQQPMSQLLLLMEIQRVFNTVKNNKKWDGPFNQQLWLLSIMSESQLKI